MDISDLKSNALESAVRVIMEKPVSIILEAVLGTYIWLKFHHDLNYGGITSHKSAIPGLTTFTLENGKYNQQIRTFELIDLVDIFHDEPHAKEIIRYLQKAMKRGNIEELNVYNHLKSPEIHGELIGDMIKTIVGYFGQYLGDHSYIIDALEEDAARYYSSNPKYAGQNPDFAIYPILISWPDESGIRKPKILLMSNAQLDPDYYNRITPENWTTTDQVYNTSPGLYPREAKNLISRAIYPGDNLILLDLHEYKGRQHPHFQRLGTMRELAEKFQKEPIDGTSILRCLVVRPTASRMQSNSLRSFSTSQLSLT